MTIDWDDKYARDGLTFDDVLLVPAESRVLPSNASVSTMLTRNIRINIPVTSSAMDTVTEHRLAIALAREGGLGFIHKNLSIEEQAEMVRKVKSATKDWPYDVISIGYPGPVIHNRPLQEPHNLGAGWVKFDFHQAFRCPVKIMNDAAMQALELQERAHALPGAGYWS